MSQNLAHVTLLVHSYDEALAFFTKALGFADLWTDMLVLVVFVLAFVAAATIILRKQEA